MDLLKIKNTLCVDIYSYADEQGITLRIVDVDKDICGWNCNNNIFINSSYETRDRWCVAHILAHIRLGTSNNLYESVDNFRIDTECENERNANMFALSLLIPYKNLNIAIDCHNITRLEDLSYVFGVSQLAMYERLKQCGIVETGV